MSHTEPLAPSANAIHLENTYKGLSSTISIVGTIATIYSLVSVAVSAAFLVINTTITSDNKALIGCVLIVIVVAFQLSYWCTAKDPKARVIVGSCSLVASTIPLVLVIGLSICV